jgi:hypothetical protein
LETPNIFRIATSDLGHEDKFTAFLHYLILCIPSIGQGMVDVICKKSGLAPATFVKAVDHPAGDAESKPDFMLSCEEFDILCEHKLDSDLGDCQLERYIKLQKNRPTYLVLISNRIHTISEDVLHSDNYLRPHSALTPFFYWEDFYPIVASHDERLAQDFMKYMRDLGIVSSPLSEDWNQLFLRPEVAEKFYEATMDMRKYFSQQLGSQCQADPSRLGIQVKYPATWLHLLYFNVSKVANPVVVETDPPYLIARVIVNEANSEYVAHLVDADIHTENGLILGRVKNKPAGWGENLVLRYEYIGSLNNYLTGKTAETRAKLLGFGKTVFEHVATAEGQL